MKKVNYNSFEKAFFFYKPSKLLVCKSKYYKIFFVIKNYYISHYILNSYEFSLNLNLNSISYKFIFTTNFFFYFNKFWNKFIKYLYIYNFIKIKFTGKGYYLFRTIRNTLGLQFNYSHKVNIYAFHFNIKKYSKRSWLFFNLDKRVLIFFLKFFKHYRPINVFTGRGIRFTKQIVYLKKKK